MSAVFQVFLIIHYQPLVNSLADFILNGDLSVFTPQTDLHSAHKNTVKHTHTHKVVNVWMTFNLYQWYMFCSVATMCILGNLCSIKSWIYRPLFAAELVSVMRS